MLSLYKGMIVLVTGGGGFIGSHVVDHLIQAGAQVRIVDNFCTGKKENIAHVQDKIEVIEGDIRDYPTCLEVTKDVQVVFHLAAEISVPGSVENPRHCFETNLMGTVNILEAARRNNVKRIVFSSSSSVYGDQGGVFVENKTPCQPQSPYALSKWQGEQLLNQFSDLYGIEAVSMRYFNVYGERQDPNSKYAAAVAKFKDNMAANKPLTFFGDGKQTRDYVPVSTVAEVNVNLGVIPAELVNKKVFNVATGTSIDLFELAEQLKPEFPHYTAGIEFAPERPGDVKHTRADCTAYQEVVKQVEL